MEIVQQGEGSGVEKEVIGNMQHQLQLLSQVIWYGPKGYYIMELTFFLFLREPHKMLGLQIAHLFVWESNFINHVGLIFR